MVHLIGIWHPPIEAAHSWRQATGLMVARNYFEGNTSFFYPMVNETNGGSGIIGMEFPLLYYLQGKLSLFFGFHPGIGRLLNVLISTIGLGYFYALLVRFTPKKVAFYATLLLGVSSYFMYSRKVMPDTAALAVYIIGTYYFFEALRFGRWRDILGAFVVLSLGMLLKISVLPLVAVGVFAYVYFRNKPKKAWVLLIPWIAVVPALCWYFVWNPTLAVNYGNWYNTGGTFVEGARVFLNEPLSLLKHLMFHPFFSYLAFALVIFGSWKVVRSEVDIAVKIAFPFFSVLFLAYALKSGVIFLTHEYYLLPLVPVLAICGAYALVELRRFAPVVMVLISVEAVANQAHDFRYNSGEAYKAELSSLSDQFIPKNALVAINGNSNPLELYFLNRKGWNLSNEALADLGFLQQIKQRGCRYMVLNRHSSSLEFEGVCVFQNQHYSIYRW
ncbi:MAG: ArnT family glycosyltransferase [Bacteroidota bacterium]